MGSKRSTDSSRPVMGSTSPTCFEGRTTSSESVVCRSRLTLTGDVRQAHRKLGAARSHGLRLLDPPEVEERVREGQVCDGAFRVVCQTSVVCEVEHRTAVGFRVGAAASKPVDLSEVTRVR